MDAPDDKQAGFGAGLDEVTPPAQTLSSANAGEMPQFEDFGDELEDLSEPAQRGPSRRFWTVLISLSTVASFGLSFGISQMIAGDAAGGATKTVTQAAQTLEPAKSEANAVGEKASDDEFEERGETVDSLPKYEEQKRRARAVEPKPAAELNAALDQFRGGGEETDSETDPEGAEQDSEDQPSALQKALVSKKSASETVSSEVAKPGTRKAEVKKPDTKKKADESPASDESKATASGGANDPSCDPPTYRDDNNIIRIKRHCLNQDKPAEE